MQIINKESRTSVFFQMNYILATPFQMDTGRGVRLQSALLEQGLEFTQVQNRGGSFMLGRQTPSPLKLIFDSPGPQVSAVQIVATNPNYELEVFARDVEAVMPAFMQSWELEQCQLIQSAAKIQHLYSTHDHAFKYLWEGRLGQSPEDFKLLGSRPVAGGGLRLLLPPHMQDQDEEPRSIEIRLESFLREPRKLLIETYFIWPRPRTIQQGQDFDPVAYLKQTESFATQEVWNFVMHQQGQEGD